MGNDPCSLTRLKFNQRIEVTSRPWNANGHMHAFHIVTPGDELSGVLVCIRAPGS